METLDQILENLNKNPEHYNTKKEENFARFDRDD